MLSFDLDALFSEQAISTKRHCVGRIRFVLTVYTQWIRFNEMRRNEDRINLEDDRYREHIDILDLIDNGLPGTYRFENVLIDFNHILRDSDLLKWRDIDDGASWFESECSDPDCFILRRHQRPKDWYSLNGDNMDSLFFAENGDDGRRGVAVQQCLDSVHFYLEHRESIGIQQMAEGMPSDPESADNGLRPDVDLEALCKDRLAIALDREMLRRRDSGSGLGPLRNRGIGAEQFSKFVITNHWTAAPTVTLASSSDEKSVENTEEMLLEGLWSDEVGPHYFETDDCFIEQLGVELLVNGLDVHSLSNLRRFLQSEYFDTDSVIADLQGIGSESSSIRKLLDLPSWSDLHRVIADFVHLYRSKAHQHTVGFRFYYWPYFRENNAAFHQFPNRSLCDGNPGYVLSDWFVAPKYSSFKSEILSNPKSGFSRNDWAETMAKATMKWSAYRQDPHHRPLICGVGKDRNGRILAMKEAAATQWHTVYGVKAGHTATIPHLMALLFYSNYPAASRQFLASFRKTVWNETDFSLKQRHSSFAVQGRLLRELVECFGGTMSQCAVKLFYCGMDCRLALKSTAFNYHGPLSTTSGLLCLFAVLFVVRTPCLWSATFRRGFWF